MGTVFFFLFAKSEAVFTLQVQVCGPRRTNHGEVLHGLGRRPQTDANRAPRNGSQTWPEIIVLN